PLWEASKADPLKLAQVEAGDFRVVHSYVGLAAVPQEALALDFQENSEPVFPLERQRARQVVA
ncbi:MAG: hypothetical protein PHP64_05735, partial [Actinomycetota bacterium]|nr:hypothetical protein [Actinomycetota bacterium]